jgi:hypothetical protein
VLVRETEYGSSVLCGEYGPRLSSFPVKASSNTSELFSPSYRVSQRRGNGDSVATEVEVRRVHGGAGM